jgi:hypothetical protein
MERAGAGLGPNLFPLFAADPRRSGRRVGGALLAVRLGKGGDSGAAFG